MLRMLISQKVSKIPDFTLCFVTFPLAPLASSSTPIFTQLFLLPAKHQWGHFCGSLCRGISDYPEKCLWESLGMLSPASGPKISLLGWESLLKMVKSISCEPLVTETASEGFLILPPSRRFLRSQASLGYHASSELCFNPNIIPEDTMLHPTANSSAHGPPRCVFPYGCSNICFESYPVPTANIKVSVTSPYHTAFPAWNSLWSGPQRPLHHFCLCVTSVTLQSYLPAEAAAEDAQHTASPGNPQTLEGASWEWRPVND